MSNNSWKIASILALTFGAVALGGAYYYYTKEDGSPKPVKKKKSKKKKTSTPTTPEAKDSGVSLQEEPPVQPLLSIKVEGLNEEERQKFAQEGKRIGNKLYSEKKFEEAIQYYNKAIEFSPMAVFYSNRAACNANLGNHEQVIKDCNEALALDPKYIKAIHRRAVAHEYLKNYIDALNDYTAVCVLEGFKNESSMAAPDRLLKTIAIEKTAEAMKVKNSVMPSHTFISAYLDSFRANPTDVSVVESLETDNASDVLLKEAFENVKAKQWSGALEKVSASIEANDFSSDVIAAKAYNLRSTFYFLMGQIDESISDNEKSLELDSQNINSIIKRATLFMEKQQLEKAMEQFTHAETLAPNNPDIYYHRGQVKFLTGDFQGAVDEYTKSISCEGPGEASVYVHIQLGVAKYKLGDIGGAEKKFKEAKRLFPNSAEVLNYHGEILMDRQTFTEALKSFDKSIEMDPTSPLPYINKAILYMQWKQDIQAATLECRKSLEVDPLCDIGYTQLAQLLCHQNQIDEAIGLYDKAITLTRTENEMINIFSCREAAAAQKCVLLRFPDAMARLA